MFYSILYNKKAAYATFVLMTLTLRIILQYIQLLLSQSLIMSDI